MEVMGRWGVMLGATIVDSEWFLVEAAVVLAIAGIYYLVGLFRGR